jgi:hypothetical protein
VETSLFSSIFSMVIYSFPSRREILETTMGLRLAKMATELAEVNSPRRPNLLRNWKRLMET